MTNPTYPLAPAKIGNAFGFRLPTSFYRDRPQFVNATGWVEVLKTVCKGLKELMDLSNKLLSMTNFPHMRVAF